MEGKRQGKEGQEVGGSLTRIWIGMDGEERGRGSKGRE